jgi:hypothetical protein
MMLTLAPKETRPTEEQAFTAIKWASNTTERCYWIMVDQDGVDGGANFLHFTGLKIRMQTSSFHTGSMTGIRSISTRLYYLSRPGSTSPLGVQRHFTLGFIFNS